MITETKKKAKEYEITSSRAFLNFKNDVKLLMFECNKEKGIWEINGGKKKDQKDAISDFLTKQYSLKCKILFIRISFTVPTWFSQDNQVFKLYINKNSIFS